MALSQQRGTQPLELSTSLVAARGIPPRFVPKLKKLGIETVRDLLWHFPTRYVDFSRTRSIAELKPGEVATIRGTVQKIGNIRTWKRRLYLLEALVSDGTGIIRAIWFNQPYLKNVFAAGTTASFAGKVSLSRGGLTFMNPMYELLPPGASDTVHTGRIISIYPETRGLTSKGIRNFIKLALDRAASIPDPLPSAALAGERFLDRKDALRKIHFPETVEEADTAKRRFAFENLFFLQLHNLRERMKLAKTKSPAIPSDIPFIKNLIGQLPFLLTHSQKKSLWEIVQDIAKPRAMNRLLQGDVGSGKTIVAAITSLLAAKNSFQTAFMAPTEILASQHYQTCIAAFPSCEHGVALLTASKARTFFGKNLESELTKTALRREIAKGTVRIVFGTHALIQKHVSFSKLGLVIVDEQHRFGVNQRAELVRTSGAGVIPHFLSMSATPIPRTLSLVLFGDLDVSLITELPRNRKQIVTKVVPPRDRPRAYRFIREQVQEGRQAFVICPRIEEAEKSIESGYPQEGARSSEMKSVKAEFEKLTRDIFPDLRVAMLHGKMKVREKDKIMRAFREGAFDILVATSVVEVGIDVPNATIMMIEGAERFGLAQLYQFRGRVGRGEHQSYCLLFSESPAQDTRVRLQSVAAAKNGLELAEQDLRLRGPGEFFGANQTGMPDLAMTALRYPKLVSQAREAAQKLLTQDPLLKKHADLQEYLDAFQRAIHWE